MEQQEQTNPETINEVRPFLANPFKNISDEDLRWLSFWLAVKK